MKSAILQRIAIAGAAALIASAVPATGQVRSEGYKFLQAVEKRERNEAIELTQQPGSTVVNARDITTGRSAMHIAVDRRDGEWVQLLLGLNADPDMADNRGTTPLMLAVQQGWVDGLQMLLGRKVRIDTPNSAGETPLIYAVHRRDTAMIRALLKAGANPDRADNSGRTARDYAAISGGSLTAEIERNTTKSSQSSGPVYGPQ